MLYWKVHWIVRHRACSLNINLLRDAEIQDRPHPLTHTSSLKRFK